MNLTFEGFGRDERRANPDVFDFVARMAAVKARKVGR